MPRNLPKRYPTLVGTYQTPHKTLVPDAAPASGTRILVTTLAVILLMCGIQCIMGSLVVIVPVNSFLVRLVMGFVQLPMKLGVLAIFAQIGTVRIVITRIASITNYST